ncbi:uncharacterized protein LOC117582367 [Drosophila guanche]|uniref:Uncharacterized protein n=1 Tax=Drosophila guanche TaxID=7266 RepID=A0A3B0JAK7_DROGU|nr:uncharacterized protein LOC117582367 [Drosophila guanche]SPP79347.1 Hypothetical predicted protein [Drosophila guanche]
MFWPDEKSFRKMGLAVILSCLALYAYVCTDMDIGPKIENAYFVNNAGCKMIAMDVMNPEIESYVAKSSTRYGCRQAKWFTKNVFNGSWHLELIRGIDQILIDNNLDNEKDIKCYFDRYTCISDWNITRYKRFKSHLVPPYRWNVRNAVYLRVSCHHFQKLLHEDVHFFIQPPPEKLLEHSRILEKWHKANETELDEPLISVMILGLDSVSHLNFLRQMPRTAYYLRNVMSHVEFWGYNKVGLNTFPNLIAMLTGESAKENEKYWKKIRRMDDCPVIWKDFKQAGYNTTLGEDYPGASLFNYLKPGFGSKPTDYYLRPAQKLMNRMGGTRSDTTCSGGRLLTDILLEMVDNILPHMQRYPFFSLYWWSQGIHEYFNFASTIDQRFVGLLRHLEDTGITNNTFIFFMSDHGSRWGSFRRTFQGMLEDNQPMLFTLYPKWMKERYPLAIKNLESNSHSLITTYDMYETMKDLLHLDSLRDNRLKQKSSLLWKLRGSETPRGVSLFLPVPSWRTCNTSNVPVAFCLCQKLTPLQLDDPTVALVARAALLSINQLLEPFPMCLQLELKAVVSAFSSVPHVTHRHDKRDFTVRFQTIPGDAYFEATSRLTDGVLHQAGEIIRIMQRNNNSNCISELQLEPFCYCAV